MTTGPQSPSSPPLPGWLGSAVQVTTQLGFPAVVAGVLLWFVLTRVGGTLEIIQKQEEDRTRMVAAMQDSVVAALDRSAERFEKAIHDNIEANRLLAAQYHQPPPTARRPE